MQEFIIVQLLNSLAYAMLLFVLAQVFLEGARMHDDLEGTV